MSEAGLRPPLLLLLPLVAATASLAGRHGNACPAPCQCHRGLLNCSRAALPAGLHRLLPPGPAARNQTFFFLDFSGNSISSIEKRVWKGYPWAEYLILKDNDLSKLQEDSLEGLLSLKHLDLSCNKILFIEKHAFEPLPFLQYINLGGNLITELRYGTFQAWHGMQFLQKLVLSHNPLSIIADTSLFELPSLKYLDLGATQVTQKTFQTLLMTSLRLETLILPSSMACCLCQMKENIEILCKTIKLHCEHLCATNSSLCVPEEPLEKMQEELMKVLQSRKLNASIVLNLEPEEPLLTNSDTEIMMLADSQYHPKSDMDLNKSVDLLPGVNYLFFKHLTKKGEINNVGLTVLPFFKLFNFNLHKGKVIPGLFKLPAAQSNMLTLTDFQHVDWANESELRKLYILANLLATELQEKLYNAENGNGSNKIKSVLKSFLTTPATHKSQAHRTEWQIPAMPGHLREHLKAGGICRELAEQCDKVLSRNTHGRKKTPERTKECVDYMMKCTREGKEKQSKKMKRETLQAKEERSKGTICCSGRKRRETKKAFKSQMQKQSDLNLHHVAQSRKKVARSLNPSSTVSVFRHHKISIPSSRRRSLPHLPTQASHLTVSFKVENNSDDLTGKIIIFLEHANKTGRKKDLDTLKAKHAPLREPKKVLIFRKHGQKGSPHFSRNNHLFQKAFHRVNSDVSHMLVERKQKHRMNSKEGVINRLSHRKSSALTDAVLENPSENNDSSLDDILPSIHQANETHWKHQKESSGFPYALSGSSSPDNYSVQGDLFEAELNNRLRSLIPNQAVRNLISHVIRTLKMDCTEPRVQLACAKLISKTGLLMKLFSEREDIKETSSLWRTYLWENGNAPNESTHQRKASKKDSEELSPEPPQYSYGNKLLLAISVTVVIMIIIAVICLIEICSQRSAASSQSTHDNKPQSKWAFQKLSQERNSKISSEAIHPLPGVSESSSMEKPLWLRDMYLPLDSIRKKSMAQKLYDRESSDEEEIFNRADVRRQYEWSSSKESY
ncbi:leucine-rich repeat-containing protein 37B isoform X2 [Mauremys reevesii]|uniref:leucine-rich repeat-containing protein 37B isoform X2 n=1 Tax=Mauremys reevesii TaxID=260615 RepID=UPI00193FC90B|nr:leucine-rich repeat-containing protein 37B isoform X2 [Mauremys reevesii]